MWARPASVSDQHADCLVMRQYYDEPPFTLQDAVAANGNGTAMDVRGHSVAALQITGTFTATVNFEITLDGSTWVAVEGVKVTDGTKSGTPTAAGYYVIPVLGADQLRARVSGRSAGNVTVVGRALQGVAPGGLADVELTTGDIELGAVELKDGTTDNRAAVDGSGRLAIQNPPNVDLAVTALRDAIAGAGAGTKTLADIVAALAGVSSLHADVGTTLHADLGSILAALVSVAVTGPVTDAQLRAAAVPVSLAAAPTTDVETVRYTTPTAGEFAPGTSAAQFPNVAAKLVRIKARLANAGNVYIGPMGVTKADGTTDTTTGLQLLAGDDTGWIPVSNLNKFYGIGDNAGDSVTYLVLA